MKNLKSLYVVLFFLITSGIAKAEEIRIAVRANKGNANALTKWQATADYLSKNISGYTFILVPFENNSALNQAVSLGNFHFCITNPASGVEHVIKYGSQPIATLVNKRRGKGYSKFGSVIFARADRDDVNTLQDLKGKMFAGVDELGFGGWRVAWLELLNNGINPYSDFSELRFTGGRQQNVVYAVRDNEVAAGSVRTDMLERMAATGKIKLSNFKILAKKTSKGFPFLLSSKLYPEWMFSSRKNIDDNLKTSMVQALFSIKTSSKAAIDGKYVQWISPLDYSSVDDLLKKLQVGPYDVATMGAYKRLFSQYGTVIFIVIFVFILMSLSFLYVLRLNKKILATQKALKKEAAMRSNLERQLMHSQRIESLGQLTGGIAHDFNNMLASILGFSELALYTDSAKKDKKLTGYLNQVITASERSSALVSQMLSFSRAETDDNKKVILSVSKIIDDINKALQLILPSTLNITIKKIDKSLFVEANSSMMTQVFMNLYLNAKDAIGRGHGTISIAAKVVSFNELNVFCHSCHQDIRGHFIEISIEDNGCGINADTIGHLFEPFFTTKEVGKGTGMGLAMVHGIVHKSDGHILVESKVGEGAVIKILLPKVGEDRNVDDNLIGNRVMPKISSNKHIILVDDEVAITTYLSEFLRQHGFNVTAFNNSGEAANYLSKNAAKISLIIIDQTMPGLTGVELAEKIHRYSADIPVILCSGYNEDINKRIKATDNIKAYLEKPIQSNKLLSEINSLLKLS